MAEALGSGQIGVEAALQVVRVAASQTQVEWLERARSRTLKHLREEVVTAQVLARSSGELAPPSDVELEAYRELERAVLQGGRVRVQPRPRPEKLLGLQQWLEHGVQMSAAAGARVVLRLRVSREARAWWRALEAQASRWLARGVSWVRFLCWTLWRSWSHLLDVDVAYGRIYLRDRYRCTSPLCSRRDVTPHHLTFRSMGGSDADENLVALCSWCHLCGIHEGKIRTHGPASHLHWEFGSREHPCIQVDGRERMAC